MTTFTELLDRISPQDAQRPLVFQTEEGNIGAGYHVTELRHSHTKGIDCGGHIQSWTEARLQLLDGPGTTHMSVAKFRTIIEKSLAAMPELADAPMLVEFGHGNASLSLKSVQTSEVEDDRLIVRLGDARAICKPFERGQSEKQSDARCCA